MPIHILPGEADSSGSILPQQPFPRAMFGSVSSFATFACETNPTYIDVASSTLSSVSPSPRTSRTILVNSGQPTNDMQKYLPSTESTRLGLMESTLTWRHMAPTAPDTLWCYPFPDRDPFILNCTPDLYITGDQPHFGTKVIEEQPDEMDGGFKRCRIILAPSFAKTGTLILVELGTLAVRTIDFTTHGIAPAGESGSNNVQ